MTRLRITNVSVFSRARLDCHQWLKLRHADLVRLGMRLQDKSDIAQIFLARFSALPDCLYGQFLAAWLMPIFLTIAGESKLFFDKRRSSYRKKQDTPRQVQLFESDWYFEQWMSFHETW